MDEFAASRTIHLTSDSEIIDNSYEIDMFKQLTDFDNTKTEAKSEVKSDSCYEASQRIDFDKREDYSEIGLPVDMLDFDTRMLKISVNLQNVYKNRFLAVSVLLVKTKDNMIISQKGKIIFTGASATTKPITQEFCFTLPGSLYEDLVPIDIRIIANYIYTNPFGSLPHQE